MKLITSGKNGQSGADSGLTARQRKLLSYFSMISDDSQRFWLGVIEDEARGVDEKRGPSLKLVIG